MREVELKAFRLNLESHADLKAHNRITDAIEAAGGIVQTVCLIRNVVVYLAEGSLLPQIEAAVGTKPGDRVG